MDGRATDGQMDGRTDWLPDRQTDIPINRGPNVQV